MTDATFHYDVDGPTGLAELAKKLKSMSAKEATQDITGLEPNHPLFNDVQKLVEKVQGESK
ncbi:hypothetical protein LTR03_010019 [Friedmanniomyces endolithicus]|nr:hypothetical protein LTR03_010019 [Friedmanniomyces endolithicus]